MIDVEDWAEIRRLHRAEQMPIRAIARHLGISRNTVRRALASDAVPKYQRAEGFDRGCGRTADQRSAAAVPGNARDGDRGTNRLDEVVLGAQAADP